MNKAELLIHDDSVTTDQCLEYATQAIHSIIVSCENADDNESTLADEILQTLNRYGFSLAD